jgi:hypothetical protein
MDTADPGMVTEIVKPCKKMIAGRDPMEIPVAGRAREGFRAGELSLE